MRIQTMEQRNKELEELLDAAEQAYIALIDEWRLSTEPKQATRDAAQRICNALQAFRPKRKEGK